MTDVQKKAYKDYVKGMKYADIAVKHGVTESAIKSWAAHYWKPEKVATSKKKVATKNNKKLQPKTQPRGAPKGNKNAIGNLGGAPERNQNNRKHGAYSKVFGDALFDDETELIDDIDTDDKIVLEQTIISLTIREKRLMKEVKRLKEESAGNKNLILGSVTKINSADENKTITVADAVYITLQKYEAELTKVQALKAKHAVELKKIMKEEHEQSNTVVDDWISAVLENE